MVPLILPTPTTTPDPTLNRHHRKRHPRNPTSRPTSVSVIVVVVVEGMTRRRPPGRHLSRGVFPDTPYVSLGAEHGEDGDADWELCEFFFFFLERERKGEREGWCVHVEKNKSGIGYICVLSSTSKKKKLSLQSTHVRPVHDRNNVQTFHKKNNQKNPP